MGSSVTESAAKTVVGRRVKNSGQRWSEPGLRGALTLRALQQSDRLPPSGNICHAIALPTWLRPRERRSVRGPHPGREASPPAVTANVTARNVTQRPQTLSLSPPTIDSSFHFLTFSPTRRPPQ